MTIDEETLEIMRKVVQKIAPRYVTHGYTLDDMEQEAYLMCLDALSRYDKTRPLENFLSVHVSNRMKNFLRDNVKVKDEEKHKIIKPTQLTHDIEITYEENIDDKLDFRNMTLIIDQNIPAVMRLDYLKIVNDFYVRKQRRQEIIDFITNLLKTHGYEKGKNL